MYWDDSVSSKKEMQRVIIQVGDYLKATKVWTINDFYEVSNDLYRDVLYSFNIKKRDGYDYEEIKRLNSDILEFSFFIPVDITDWTAFPHINDPSISYRSA